MESKSREYKTEWDWVKAVVRKTKEQEIPKPKGWFRKACPNCGLALNKHEYGGSQYRPLTIVYDCGCGYEWGRTKIRDIDSVVQAIPED